MSGTAGRDAACVCLFTTPAQIDPAFAHFENLRELDLGRNHLQVLKNLPTRLVSLSCAGNELCGKIIFEAVGAR